MTINRQDLAVGAIFVAIASFFALNTFFGFFQPALPIGNPQRMGPGFFPIMLAGILFVVGIAIALKGLRGTPMLQLNAVPWRGILIILPVPVIFALTVRGLGLVLATFIAAFITSFASRRMTPLLAVGVSLGLTVFCVAVFHYGLRLPMPLFGRWVGGY
jgi:hypothetical protein